MTPYELTQLTINAISRLDTSWALFWSIHAALFGGIVYIDRPLRLAEKIVSICAYLTIAFYNYYLIRSSQKLLSSLYQDIHDVKEAENLNLNVLDYFGKISTSDWSWASHSSTVAIHIIALIVVIVAIVMDAPLKTKQNKPVNIRSSAK